MLKKRTTERCHPKKISGTKSTWVFLAIGAVILMMQSLAYAETRNSSTIRDRIYSNSQMSKYKEFKNCIYWEAKKNKIDELILMAVILAEFGDPETVSRNNDGTNDYSIMQINDVRMGEVVDRGFDPQRTKIDGCYNIRVGSEILGSEIKNANYNLWLGIGRYHYHEKGKNPHNHYKYRARVANKLHYLIGFTSAKI
ncbi:lytic transglycosylase domain-containing protein (plasmid) [Shewanella xiamenensis]|uniref:Lytic transglycosylase domain-containing protein n=1 Tax=Shewanella xiamenensis TaxID=332186 RepID=A0ABT6UIE5_9GAMM|nr:lytic transglycosylase domain-containing protein [Shewanella xiamenensis]MDI5833291.1 lytic transglycosylase domain-containing protein [Shewanella xiamenensis]WHF57959.1 lytic transglycosylase domain-containing protein [Shewanella xiamenensis]